MTDVISGPLRPKGHSRIVARLDSADAHGLALQRLWAHARGNEIFERLARENSAVSELLYELFEGDRHPVGPRIATMALTRKNEPSQAPMVRHRILPEILAKSTKPAALVVPSTFSLCGRARENISSDASKFCVDLIDARPRYKEKHIPRKRDTMDQGAVAGMF